MGSPSAGPEPQRTEDRAAGLPSACGRLAHRSERGTFPEGEGGSLDLESAPMGPWGPAGLSLAQACGRWPGRGEGAGRDAWLWEGERLPAPLLLGNS